MTSYFEIAGQIIETGAELAGYPIKAEPQTFQSLIPLLETESKQLYESISSGPKSSQSGDGRGSLARHWVRSVTYPTERILEDPTGMFGLPTFAVKVYTDLIGKHYDYFIKGEDPWINYQD
ncbi:MAG: hypothetical protein [Circular genetic element sp.]|nr:MAG: hypothetical protein [Circular genetic element sp.]